MQYLGMCSFVCAGEFLDAWWDPCSLFHNDILPLLRINSPVLAVAQIPLPLSPPPPPSPAHDTELSAMPGT